MQKPAVDNVLPQEFKLEIPEIKKSLPLAESTKNCRNSKERDKPARLVHGTRLDSAS